MCTGCTGININNEDNLPLIRLVDQNLVKVFLPRPLHVALNVNLGLVVLDVLPHVARVLGKDKGVLLL